MKKTYLKPTLHTTQLCLQGQLMNASNGTPENELNPGGGSGRTGSKYNEAVWDEEDEE